MGECVCERYKEQRRSSPGRMAFWCPVHDDIEGNFARLEEAAVVSFKYPNSEVESDGRGGLMMEMALRAIKELHSEVVSLVECIEECEKDGGNAYGTLGTRQKLGEVAGAIRYLETALNSKVEPDA